MASHGGSGGGGEAFSGELIFKLNKKLFLKEAISNDF